jgi:hypothetical protein
LEVLMNDPTLRKINLEQALFDPASIFRQPDDVVEHPSLALEHKVEILCRWAYDAMELAVAERRGWVAANLSQLARSWRRSTASPVDMIPNTPRQPNTRAFARRRYAQHPLARHN